MWLDAEYWRGLMLRRAWSVVGVKVVYTKADRHKSHALSPQQRTDQPTDRTAYRVACKRLKTRQNPW